MKKLLYTLLLVSNIFLFSLVQAALDESVETELVVVESSQPDPVPVADQPASSDPNINLAFETDVVPPEVATIQRVLFANRVGDPTTYSVIPPTNLKPYRVGPLYYLITFSEPVSGLVTSVLRLASNSCPALASGDSACSVITSVSPLNTAESSAPEYTSWVVELDSLDNAGTQFLDFVYSELEISGISDVVVDAARNPLSIGASLLPDLKAEYAIDTVPLQIDGQPYFDDAGVFRIPFNKSIGAGVSFSANDLQQFLMQFGVTDVTLGTVISPTSSTIVGSEILIAFPVGTSTSQHSLMKYVARSDLAQLLTESGVPTKSFSVETFLDGSYVICSPIGLGCSAPIQAPDVPVVTSVQFIDSGGNPISSGTFTVGQTIYIRINFSEMLSVSAGFDATLLLNTGPINTLGGTARFDDTRSLGTAINNPNRLTDYFVMAYTIKVGDLNADLDAAASVFSVISGSAADIDETDGKAHDLSDLDVAIPEPQTTGSLSDQSQIVIDGRESLVSAFVPITVEAITIPSNQHVYSVGGNIVILVRMSGLVTVDITGGPPTLRTTIIGRDGSPREAVFSGVMPDLDPNNPGDYILSFKYTIQVGDNVTELNYPFNNAIFLNGGGIFQPVQDGSDVISIVPSLSLPQFDGPYSLGGRYNIQIDTEAPLSPTVSTTTGTSTNIIRPTFDGTGEPGATVVVTEGVAPIITVCTAIVAPNGAWSCTVTTDLAEGPHSFTIAQTDLAGNTSTGVVPLEVIIDVVPPILPTVGGDENSSTTDNTPTFSGTGEPGSMIYVTETGSLCETSSVYSEDDCHRPVCSAIVAPDRTWTCTSERVLAIGLHSFLIYQVDTAGNSSDSYRRSITVLGTAEPAVVIPIVSISSGGGGGGGFAYYAQKTEDETVPEKDDTPIEFPKISETTLKSCPVVRGYWDVGDRGNGVRRIKRFLNIYEGENLKLTRVYDLDTFAAVKRFQMKYSKEILKPWGLTAEEATGFWYVATSRHANSIAGCPTVRVELPNGAVIR